jgi:hypothetical protein
VPRHAEDHNPQRPNNMAPILCVLRKLRNGATGIKSVPLSKKNRATLT